MPLKEIFRDWLLPLGKYFTAMDARVTQGSQARVAKVHGNFIFT
jgi:hypothetical protein